MPEGLLLPTPTFLEHAWAKKVLLLCYHFKYVTSHVTWTFPTPHIPTLPSLLVLPQKYISNLPASFRSCFEISERVVFLS